MERLAAGVVPQAEPEDRELATAATAEMEVQLVADRVPRVRQGTA